MKTKVSRSLQILLLELYNIHISNLVPENPADLTVRFGMDMSRRMPLQYWILTMRDELWDEGDLKVQKVNFADILVEFCLCYSRLVPRSLARCRGSHFRPASRHLPFLSVWKKWALPRAAAAAGKDSAAPDTRAWTLQLGGNCT
ncbi:unnamed protein product [Sympodiomycopsis kandeliae]